MPEAPPPPDQFSTGSVSERRVWELIQTRAAQIPGDYQKTEEKGVAEGYAPLDENGLVPRSFLPPGTGGGPPGGGGGSGFYQLDITPSTPGITTGVVVDLPVGAFVYSGIWLVVYDAFDGTYPCVWLEENFSHGYWTGPLSSASADNGYAYDVSSMNSSPFVVKIDNVFTVKLAKSSDGSDPGSTVGDARLMIPYA